MVSNYPNKSGYNTVVTFQKKLCLQFHKIEERNYLDEEIDFPSWKKKKKFNLIQPLLYFPPKGWSSLYISNFCSIEHADITWINPYHLFSKEISWFLARLLFILPITQPAWWYRMEMASSPTHKSTELLSNFVNFTYWIVNCHVLAVCHWHWLPALEPRLLL